MAGGFFTTQPLRKPQMPVVSYKNHLAIRNRENVKEKGKTSRAKEKRDDVKEQAG